MTALRCVHTPVKTVLSDPLLFAVKDTLSFYKNTSTAEDPEAEQLTCSSASLSCGRERGT